MLVVSVYSCRASLHSNFRTDPGSAGSGSSNASANPGHSNPCVTNSQHVCSRNSSRVQTNGLDSTAGSAPDGAGMQHTRRGRQGARHSASFRVSAAFCGGHSRLQSAADASVAVTPSRVRQLLSSQGGLPRMPHRTGSNSATRDTASSAARRAGQGHGKQQTR